jgi:hypothetical protein
MRLVLKRTESGPQGTFGTLSHNGKHLCYTLEDPWNDNQKRISCIPKGVYSVVRHGWAPDTKVKFKRVWHVLDVPNRDAILIHAGNTIDDTIGCILVGTARGDIDKRPGIVGSRAAVEMLRGYLDEKFTLQVE